MARAAKSPSKQAPAKQKKAVAERSAAVPGKPPSEPSTKAPKKATRAAAKKSADRSSRPARSSGEHEDAAFSVGAGGETHQTSDGGPRLTTQQGVPVADDQNTLAGRRPRPGAARGLPLPREDLPLRPRAHPRARRARPRLRRPRLLRAVRVAAALSPRRPVPAARRAHPGVRAVLDGGRQQGLVRPGPRRPRLRRQVLHAGGQLGSRRQQHPGVLHPGRHQVPRPRALGEAGARPRLPAGAVGARQLLGLHLADARSDAHGDVDDVRPGDPPLVPVHGGLRRPQLPLRSTPPARRASSSSTGSRRRACSRCCGTRRSRSTAPTPTSTVATCGTPSRAATSRSGSSACRCSTTSSPTASTSTSSTPPRSSPRSSCRSTPIGRMVLDRMRRQLLRRDRAGGVLHAERRARHRLHERPAAAGPQLLLPRHPAQAARRPELHAHPGERAEVPGRPLPAGRPHGDDEPGRAGSTTSRTRATGDRAGPARIPIGGFTSFPAAEAGRQGAGALGDASPTTTARPASSSSARRRSSRQHIVNGFVFELSKVEDPTIRTRMVANLRNVDEAFATAIADGLGLAELPAASTPARAPITDLPPSAALSILNNGPADVRRPQGRRPRHRRHRRRPSSPRCRRRSRPRARCSS